MASQFSCRRGELAVDMAVSVTVPTTKLGSPILIPPQGWQTDLAGTVLNLPIEVGTFCMTQVLPLA